jgi:CRISPR-associated protein Csm4
MKKKVVKLKFTSPFHLNPPRDSLEKTETVIQSDMLVSALAVSHTKLYGTFCQEFFSGELRVSSLFPFYKDTLYLPVPLFDFWSGKIDRKIRKKLAKIKYLEVSLWEKVIAGERLKADEVHPVGMFGVCAEKTGEISELFQEEEVQRLGKDPFYFSQVRLKEEGGLFFFYDVTPGIEQQFKACLRLLGDEGLGSDKTVGKGLFEIKEETEHEFPHPDNPASHLMSLSFFIPSKEDFDAIDFNDSYYFLQHKRGWYITYKMLSLKKKGIFGFSEGSVFKTKNGHIPTGKEVILLEKEAMKEILERKGIELDKDSTFDVLRSGFWFGIPTRVPTGNSY